VSAWLPASFFDRKTPAQFLQTLFVSTRKVNDDQFVVELFGKTPDGKKGPTMETTYTRRK
jgi:hypothetical protein